MWERPQVDILATGSSTVTVRESKRGWIVELHASGARVLVSFDHVPAATYLRGVYSLTREATWAERIVYLAKAGCGRKIKSL
jgi:hypothetical protein